jgi:hypothetical protein
MALSFPDCDNRVLKKVLFCSPDLRILLKNADDVHRQSFHLKMPDQSHSNVVPYSEFSGLGRTGVEKMNSRTSSSWILSLVGALAAFLAINSSLSAAPIVYVTDLQNDFGTLDLSTGAFTQIGTLNLPAGDAIYGMGFGADGNLYGLDSDPDANLWQINPATAAVTEVGTTDQSAAGATADAAGTMFALSQDISANYFTLTPPSTSTNVIATTGYSAAGLAAVTPDGSAFYITVQSNTSPYDDLASVNVSTGEVTDIGSTGYTPDTGLFVDGTLYGFDTSSNAIVTLDTTTGAGTYVATYNLPDGENIVAAALPVAVPEPAGIAVLAFAGLALGRRRMKKAGIAK